MPENIKRMRQRTGLSQSKFAAIFGIPTRTYQHWETGFRQPPDYVIKMMDKILIYDGLYISSSEHTIERE